MTFSPRTNTTGNFPQRLEAFRETLQAEGLRQESVYQDEIGRVFGYERAVQESTLASAALACVRRGRADVLPRLLPLLSSLEVNRFCTFLIQDKLPQSIPSVLPLLDPTRVPEVFLDCLRHGLDDPAMACVPFLNPLYLRSEHLDMAVQGNTPQAGAYLLQHVNPFDVVKASTNASHVGRLAGWWQEAIEAQRLPAPDLGRASKHWCKKFPALSALLRNRALSQSLPTAPPAVARKPRF